MEPPVTTTPQHQSKTKLLDAALSVIRVKGYSATTVDDICAAAGITKGSFFHHFKSKDDLALAATAHFNSMADALFANAPYQNLEDPFERLLGYIDLRIALLSDELAQCTCLLGTLVQETYATHPQIRSACEDAMAAHIAQLTRDVEAAKQRYARTQPWSAHSVGDFIQGVLQGSFVLAKANLSAEVARQNLEHLRRYLCVLFDRPPDATAKKPSRSTKPRTTARRADSPSASKEQSRARS